MMLVLALSMLVESGLDSATRFSFRYVIDEAVGPRDPTRLIVLFVALGSAAAVIAVFCILGDYFWAKLGTLVVNELRTELLSHLQKLSMDYFARRNTGDLLSCLMADAESIENTLVTVVPYAAVGLSGIGFSLVFMTSIHPWMALFTLGGLGVCFALPRLLMRRARIAALEVRQRQGQVSSRAQEILQTQAVIKAYGLERELLRRFTSDRDRLVKCAVHANFLSYTAQRVPLLGFFMLSLLVLGSTATLAAEGKLTVGELVSFQVLMLGLTSGIANLTWLAPLLVEAQASIERVQQILREEPSVREISRPIELGPLKTGITVEQVRFSYPTAASDTAACVLRGVTFTAVKGSLTVIVGPSGSGKTSILNLLLRLFDPNDGWVLFDGVDIRNARIASLRSQIALVAQEIQLFEGTIGENIQMGSLQASEGEIWTALEAADIAELVRALPEGLDSPLGERAARLSGGERQRLALARALVRRPSILVLDEPTSALDAQHESDLLATLKGLVRERQLTIIAVTHRPRLASVADQVLVVEDGQIVLAGRHEELLAKEGTYAAFWSDAAAD